MKIGIHSKTGNFSERWIKYCEEKGIKYKIVNCYDNDIIDQLRDCDALMWHHYEYSKIDYLFAKQLLFAIQVSGKKVFPNFNTNWHYDDKIGQKYLFESIDAPLVPTYIFYSKEDAFRWLNETNFPKVFKLRNGAGSWNVKIVKNRKIGYHLVNKAFDKGFEHTHPPLEFFKETWRNYKLGKNQLSHVKTALKRFIYIPKRHRKPVIERDYIYFQEFIPDNYFDIRVIVIYGRAFAIKRMVRENDFRASGSGDIQYSIENFNEETIQLAFSTAKKIGSQCAGFDIIYQDKKPLIVEVSFAFTAEVYEKCEGYWDENLNFYKGQFNPYGWMVDSVLDENR
ncbi:Glutathione synthase/Ribosomal protein S6 modification enzyme (glutaminyl transferase) [Aquiflexum balticum DSM 16537]|uniref:Glutathione synthase/Ribosomal protein S6 modification enzyme (Glutaminyl transferase) n=1 Tax=Aquiflexum balticum DSM 16537 TaxID=758820 RepID=A0A1W2HBX7_9BACT|nr:hypothetical protein [Aquiflexum balticum]SMD46311.1 Glutathione synthase/Ribosomal protein S6 modification enzyme (glutaminyl transferase) [Aquiflexum balticum DSM 16537]